MLSIIASLGNLLLIIAALSRAGLIAFGMQIICFVFLIYRNASPKYMFILLSIILLLFSILMVFWDKLLERITSIFDVLLSPFNADRYFDIRRRMRMWMADFNLIKDNTLTGVGIENMHKYLYEYGAVKYVNGKEIVVHPHGGFLFFTVIGGFLVLIPFIIFLFCYFRFLLNKLKRSKSIVRSIFIEAAIISIIGINISAISANPFYLNIFWFSLGFVLSGINVINIHNT